MNQRYFLVDGKHAMIGGTDLFDDVICCLIQKKKRSDYYWIEYGITFTPDTSFINFCSKNYRSNGKAVIATDNIVGNFHEYNSEHDGILNMIRYAEDYIYIENQYIDSNHITHNRIIDEIGNKIIRMVISGKKDFRVYILTNITYADTDAISTNNLLDKFLSWSYTVFNQSRLYHSMRFLMVKLRKYISEEDIERILHVYFQKPGILIHAKLVVTDGNKLNCSTSNIQDSSFVSAGEREIGIRFQGEKAGIFLDEILKQYTDLGRDKSIKERLESSEYLYRYDPRIPSFNFHLLVYLVFFIYFIILMKRKSGN